MFNSYNLFKAESNQATSSTQVIEFPKTRELTEERFQKIMLALKNRDNVYSTFFYHLDFQGTDITEYVRSIQIKSLANKFKLEIGMQSDLGSTEAITLLEAIELYKSKVEHYNPKADDLIEMIKKSEKNWLVEVSRSISAGKEGAADQMQESVFSAWIEKFKSDNLYFTDVTTSITCIAKSNLDYNQKLKTLDVMRNCLQKDINVMEQEKPDESKIGLLPAVKQKAALQIALNESKRLLQLLDEEMSTIELLRNAENFASNIALLNQHQKQVDTLSSSATTAEDKYKKMLQPVVADLNASLLLPNQSDEELKMEIKNSLKNLNLLQKTAQEEFKSTLDKLNTKLEKHKQTLKNMEDRCKTFLSYRDAIHNKYSALHPEIKKPNNNAYHSAYANKLNAGNKGITEALCLKAVTEISSTLKTQEQMCNLMITCIGYRTKNQAVYPLCSSIKHLISRGAPISNITAELLQTTDLNGNDFGSVMCSLYYGMKEESFTALIQNEAFIKSYGQNVVVKYFQENKAGQNRAA